MIRLVDGEIYLLETPGELVPGQEINSLLSQTILNFYQDGHQNDLICIQYENGQKLYMNDLDVQNGTIDAGCWETICEEVFHNTYVNSHIKGGIPLLNREGEPVAIAKYVPSVYNHSYASDDAFIDGEVFNLYQCICLYDVNEYSWIIYRKCLENYFGKIILFGREWEEWCSFFPDIKPSHAEVIFISSKEDLERETAEYKTMHLRDFLSVMAGHEERCREGIFSYDEIMTLLFCFANEKRKGPENPDRKFFVIDGYFLSDGLIAVLIRLSAAYAYVLAKGYVPIIRLKGSYHSHYCDFTGDDIWNKFFIQPSGYDTEVLENSCSVTISPNFCISFSCMKLMRELSGCGTFDLITDQYFNDRLKAYIDKEQKRILEDPSSVLGVLIRGSDYVKNRPKGHAVQASVEQMIDKIKSAEWNHYKYIYVATEDENILDILKKEFGNKLIFTNQKRYSVEKGQLLYEMKKDRENDGWLRGAEYMAALCILAKCDSLIASGYCAGTSFALKVNDGRYRHCFVFQLGNYE